MREIPDFPPNDEPQKPRHANVQVQAWQEGAVLIAPRPQPQPPIGQKATVRLINGSLGLNWSPRAKRQVPETPITWPKYCGTKGQDCIIVNSKLRDNPKRRYRRQTQMNITPSEPELDCEHVVIIQVLNSKLVLCVFQRSIKDEPILRDSYEQINVHVIDGNQTEVSSLSSHNHVLSSGYVIGEPMSSLSGFVINGSFYGSIYRNHITHFLEPWHPVFKVPSVANPEGYEALLHSIDHMQSTVIVPSIYNATSSPGKVCEMSVVADPEFFHDVGGGDIQATTTQMIWFLKEANSLLKTKDFDDSGSSDCMGVSVKNITIYKTNDFLTGNFSVPEVFLKRFSRYDFEGYCLGVLFTNRIFNDLVLGLSWRGNPEPDGVGGVCQNRVKMKSDGNQYSFNALFVSLKSANQLRIPLWMGVLNILHEIMHSLGAQHDPEPKQSVECTPKDRALNGRYLMSAFSNDGRKLNHMMLSPCTKKSVLKNFASPTRTVCLKQSVNNLPFCGDGIVSPGEECDCGSVLQCLSARACCVPPNGDRGRDGQIRPCTFNGFGTNCSTIYHSNAVSPAISAAESPVATIPSPTIFVPRRIVRNQNSLPSPAESAVAGG